LVWQRGSSHVALPRGVVETFLLVAVAAKAYGINGWIAVMAATTVLVAIIVAGFWDVHSGFYKTEQSMNNQHNRELMKAAGRK